MIRVPADGDYGRPGDRAGSARLRGLADARRAAHDRIVPVADLESFDHNAPTASTVLLEDSGHLLMLERPRALVEQIDRFLDETALDAGHLSWTRRPPEA